MSTTSYTPYTYVIGWTAYNKWYYGVRTARKSNCLYKSGCHPDDLWITYFTSSPSVVQFRQEHGEPDVIKIRKTFESKEQAQYWESTVLKRLKAKDQEKWLNKHDSCNKNFGGCPKGYKFGKGKKCYHNPLTFEKRFFWPDDKIPNGFVKGEIPKSSEHLEKIKKSKKQNGYSKQGLNNIRKSIQERKQRGDFVGNNNANARPVVIEGIEYGSRKEAMEKLNRNASHIRHYLKTGSFPSNKIKCQHCGMVTTKSNHSRWHGDNCCYQDIS